MRGTFIAWIIGISLCVSGSAWAAGRGRAPAGLRAEISRHDGRRVADGARRDLQRVRPVIIYAGAPVEDSTAVCTDGSASSEPADCAPAVDCPPTVDFLVERNAARDEMDSVQARLTADMQASPQWNALNANVARGVAELESAEQRIETSLSVRPDYQAAVVQKQVAEELIDEMRASGEDDPAELTPIAQRDLSASKLITQLQTQALAADPQWDAAHAGLQSTAAGRAAMLNQLHADLLNDPSWQAARERLG